MASGKTKIEASLSRIRGEIEAACARSGRDPREVAIVAVTKSASLEAIRHILDLGVCDLGESRVQQLVERAGEIAAGNHRRKPAPAPPRWHMIGHLQRNKVAAALNVAEYVHSIDSLRLAEDIEARAEADNKIVQVLLQVNCSGEPQKFGVPVGAAMHLAELISTLKHVRIVGLMTMAPRVDNPQDARPTFALLRELFDELRHQKAAGEHVRHLSMGMSQDYAVAVEEGATLLRIGTALFG